MKKQKVDLARLLSELSHRFEERELLMAAERFLTVRERVMERALLAACDGDRKAAEMLRRIATRHRADTHPEETVKQLCWPQGVYAPALAEMDDATPEEAAACKTFWEEYDADSKI